jgi:hypothetical protein
MRIVAYTPDKSLSKRRKSRTPAVALSSSDISFREYRQGPTWPEKV